MRISRHLALKLRLFVAVAAVVGALLACSPSDNGGGGNITPAQFTLSSTGVRTYLKEVFGGHQEGNCTRAVPARDGLAGLAPDEVIAGHDHWVDGEPGCDDFAAYVYRGLILFDLSQVTTHLTSVKMSSNGLLSARLSFNVLTSTDDLGTALPDCAANLELVTGAWPGPYSAAMNATPTPNTAANAALPGPVIILATPQDFPTGVTVGPSHEYALPSPVPSTDVTSGAIQVTTLSGQPPTKRFSIDVIDWVKSWVDGTANNGFMFTSVNENRDGSWTSSSFCRTHLGSFRLDISTL